jgi:hypothetical protein
MATVEQLSAALVKADAEGNTADAKVFADALRALKAQGGGSPQMDAAGFAQHLATGEPSQNIERAPRQAPPRPDLMTSTAATVNGLVSSVPFLQESTDALVGAGGMLMGKDYGETVRGLQQKRQQIAQTAPIARGAGQIGGMLMGTGALGMTARGAEALGMSGGFGKQLVNAGLSTAGYEGLQGLAQGKQGGELLTDMGIGAGSGVLGNVAGQAVNKLGQSLANTVTRGAQKKLTSKAIEKAASADDLFAAGSKLFDQATGGTPLQVTDNAYFRMLGDVQQATKKYRPNDLNNPEAVGLLRQLWQVGDELSAGTGVAVDFKDLHILRQSAQAVTQKGAASDQTKTIARLVVKSIDDFIGTLKPADIAGGADPRAASNALLTGISTWSKASKVSLIDEAIQAADTYKSGTEMGLKSAFTNLMKSPDFKRFNKVEQDAIREVAKGTTMQNALALLGRSGFSLGGGGGHNIIGGTMGAMTGTAALTPILGPLAPAASLGLSMGGAAMGRAGADRIATKAAERAARVMATTNIPVARQAPNLLAPARVPLDILIRGGIPAASGR